MSKIKIKKLKKFKLEDGDVYHALKASESEYYGFKEAYFSTIKNNKIKAWKRHYKMTMNLIVPIGKVQFIFYDENKNLLKNLMIGEENYSRITVPPMIWFGFKGVSLNTSYILNISNEIHDPLEVERKPLTFLNFLT
jgi:dTDP-4-dehydrorhamnose 3,5-epimerase